MKIRISARAVWLGVALALAFVPVVSRAQPVDVNAAAEAKAQAGREALSHPVTDSAGPKTGGTFVTFDVPGAQGTSPASINPAGDITGSYSDANGLGHSFVRSSNGTVTTFDVPGGTTSGASSINPAASVTGNFVYFNDPNFAVHGFLRDRNGSFITFDAPGAESIPEFLGTNPSGINPATAITGTYFDHVALLADGSLECVSHGFLRTNDGTIATFDAPAAGTNPIDCLFNGTQAADISPEKIILGIYTDTNGINHGFLRTSDGTFTTFDPPGQIGQIFLGNPFSFGNNLQMNSAGVITGNYFQPISGNPFGGNYRVFVRAIDGTFTTFDAVLYPNGNPSLNIPCCTWSFPSGITPGGAITGSFNDGFTINHGFLRASDGAITTFDVPGAGKGSNQGTAPLGITPSGEIMGLYIDANGVRHGFLFLPKSCC
jgi:hypothetical protein